MNRLTRWLLLSGLLLPLAGRSQPANSPQNPVDTRRYAIEVAGVRVGTMTATRQQPVGETVTYTLVSDVKVNFLVYKLRIYYKVTNLFRRGQLQVSTVETRTNRGDFLSHTEWKADHYQIVAEQYKYSYRATETRPITEAVTNLYFAEPTGQPTAFAEYFGDYVVLSPGKTPGSYRARRDGREDEYQYEQGRLVKIIKKNPLKNFVITLLR
jgi:hypothetical protein